MKISELNFTVDIFVFMLPPSILKENLVKWTLGPVCFFEDSEESVEVNFLDQDLLSFLGVLDLLANCFVLNGPVEATVLDIINVFAKINDIELVFDAPDGHWLG